MSVVLPQVALPRMRVTVVPHTGHLPLAMRRPLVSWTSPFSGRFSLALHAVAFALVRLHVLLPLGPLCVACVLVAEMLRG